LRRMNGKPCFAGLLLVPVLLAVVTIACSESPRSCSGIQADALAELTKAATSVPQCVVDSDCKPIGIPGDCLDCVFLAGNDNARAAVAARADAVAALCASFHNSGCVVVPSGCPGVGSWTCEGGRCTAR
jgi:hypothetical protein